MVVWWCSGISEMKDLCKPDPRNKSFNITLELSEKVLAQVQISNNVLRKIQKMMRFAKKIYL